MENKLIEVDYARECEELRFRLEETMRENEKYKQALVNICLKV
jgi:hypothetical protein